MLHLIELLIRRGTATDERDIVTAARERVVTFWAVALNATRAEEAMIALAALNLVIVPYVMVCVNLASTRVLSGGVVAEIAAFSMATTVLRAIHYRTQTG
jgi:hypothetical protein